MKNTNGVLASPNKSTQLAIVKVAVDFLLGLGLERMKIDTDVHPQRTRRGILRASTSCTRRRDVLANRPGIFPEDGFKKIGGEWKPDEDQEGPISPHQYWKPRGKGADRGNRIANIASD
jgi:hypothetical protein